MKCDKSAEVLLFVYAAERAVSCGKRAAVAEYSYPLGYIWERRLKMTWYEVLIVSVGLSLDVFAYALYKGAMVSEINVKKLAKMAAVFALWQMGAMLAGSMISEIPLIAERYQKARMLYGVLSAILFFGVGVIMIGKALRGGEVLEHREDSFDVKQICAWSAITSVDSFLAGIGLGLLNTQLSLLVLQLAVVTVVTIAAGIWIGYRLGCQMRYGAMKLGGVMLFLAGLDVLIRYL